MCDGNHCELLRAKLKQEFLNAKKNILLHYSRYVNSGAPKLTISIDVELAPDPRKYTNSGQEMPTEKEIIVKEQLLKHEFVTNNLNIQKCNICLECHMEKDVMMKQDSFTCKKCKDRNDPNHFIKNNMHPLWYEIEDDGSFQMDSNGKKIPQFDRPHELLRLSMAEKLLIWRCANFCAINTFIKWDLCIERSLRYISTRHY